ERVVEGRGLGLGGAGFFHPPSGTRRRHGPLHPRTVPAPCATGAWRHATIRPMGHDDRFDDLIASLAGFHRSWLIHLGLELGLFRAIRAAGAAGLTPDELATRSSTHPPAIETWSWAADAHDLVVLEDGRLTIDEDLAAM